MIRRAIGRQPQVRALLAGYRYLKSHGHMESTRLGRPVDSHGRSIPWLPYPAIEYLDQHLRPDDRVLEIGGGASTVWLQHRVSHVDVIESNDDWAVWIDSNTDESVSLVLDASPGEYDVVLIDGDDRLDWYEPSRNASVRLIVLDDINRYDIEEGLILRGITPGGVQPSATLFVHEHSPLRAKEEVRNG